MIHFTQLSRKNFKLIPVLDDEYKCVMCDKLEKFYSRKFYITYLEKKKKSIIISNENVHPIKKVKWSGAITDYIELVYSLANSRTINQGEISFKDLHESFAYIFEFEREVNIHNTMNEIKKRKNNPTKFLDKLRDHLDDYINK